MNLNQVIIKPMITEKATAQAAENKYCFKVAFQANRAQVKQAIAQTFGVKVIGVNLINVHGKTRGGGHWKKAIVELKEGEKLETLFPGTEGEKKDKKNG